MLPTLLGKSEEKARRRRSTINLNLPPKEALNRLLMENKVVQDSTTSSHLSTSSMSNSSSAISALPIALLNKVGKVFMKPLLSTNSAESDGDSNSLLLLKAASDHDLIEASRLRILSLGMLAHCFHYPDDTFPSKSKEVASSASSSSTTDGNSTPATYGKRNRRMSVAAVDRVIPLPPSLPRCWPPDFEYDYKDGDDSCNGPSPSIRSAVKAGTSSKGPSKPSGPKLKQVYWDQLTDAAKLDKSLWSKNMSGMLPDYDILFDDIVEIFSAKAATKLNLKTTDKGGKDGDNKASKKIKMFLDPQRAQAIGIMLSKFGKKTPDDIAKAIMDMNTQAMGASQVSSIMNLMPQPEEIDSLTQHVASGDEVCTYMFQCIQGTFYPYLFA